MKDRTQPPPMSWTALLAVLFGFPAIFYLHSQVLLHRDLFQIGRIDFFITFWLATAVIYAIKIGVITWLLRRHRWTLADVGLNLDRHGALRLLGGYCLFAALLFAGIEWSVSQVQFDADKLASLPGLYPDTSAKRGAFLLLALVAGVSEELTYRGFAINGLASRGLNRWAAIPLAAIPFVFQHGLKSLDQFWWFFGNGLFLGALFVVTRSLMPGIILHWLIILSAMLGIFTALAS